MLVLLQTSRDHAESWRKPKKNFESSNNTKKKCRAKKAVSL